MNTIENPLDKVNEWLLWVNEKLNDFQKNIIDDNLNKLQVADKASDLMAKVSGILDINLFGLWTIATLVGTSSFKIMEKFKNNKIVALVFKKYGGLEWLQKSYIQETLDKFFVGQPEKIDVIKGLYSAYGAEKADNLCTDILSDPDSLNVVCGLWLNTITPTTITDKIPSTKFSYLSATTLQWIAGKEKYLDPNVLASVGCIVPKKMSTNGVEIIDEASSDWKPESIDKAIIEKYLAQKITEFVGTEWYISSIPSSDHLALALFWGFFVSGNTFPEAVLLGVKKPIDFGWTPEVVATTMLMIVDDMTQEAIQEELTKANSPLTKEMVVVSAKKYGVPLSYLMAFMKNDSTYGTKWLAVDTYNPGNVGNMDGGSTYNFLYIDFKYKTWPQVSSPSIAWTNGVDAAAENLKARIDAYHTQFGETVNPTPAELASGKKAGTNEKFFGVYMTAEGGPAAVQSIQSDISDIPENTQA